MISMLPAFSRKPFSFDDRPPPNPLALPVVDDVVAVELDVLVDEVETTVRLPLSTDLRSLDSTLRELPVESLVMVTEPPPVEAAAAANAGEADAADVEVVMGEVVGELGLQRLLPAESLAGAVVIIELEDLTGEIVTLLLSFLWGELEPKRRPSSSSTLSKAEELELGLLSSLIDDDFVSGGGAASSSLALKLLTVRLLRSIKSFGLSSTRLTDDEAELLVS